MPSHGLTEAQLGTICQILAPYAETITRVDLFGSRARGTYQAHSDVDLVLHGVEDEALIDRLWTLFAESNLPLKVDVKSYEQTQYPPLKRHMDSVCQTLWKQQDLRRVAKQLVDHSQG
ncbi:MAG: nucleotidyltransferase domain-containing protein [Candidatus Melainabacteria bacterium]|nr:nucleotidyltransferase domain-containing protein [Candidatus Melainabacteria bacterium]